MEILVWIGAGLTVLGLGGLVWCIVAVMRAKRAGLDDNAIKARLRQVVAVNMGALGVSAIGLMMVITGIMLG